MIKEIYGNIFNSDCIAIVNPVNCVGVMGAGLALEFKKRYPEMFIEYKKLCGNGLLKPGIVHLYKHKNMKYIINFPTKDHWKDQSRIEYIKTGIDSMIASLKPSNINSVAIPALGCGLGGLDFNDVKTLIYEKLSNIEWLTVEFYIERNL